MRKQPGPRALLTRWEALQLAARLYPGIRNGDGQNRRLHAVGADGKVVRTVTLREHRQRILKSVDMAGDWGKPIWDVCPCGRVFKAKELPQSVKQAVKAATSPTGIACHGDGLLEAANRALAEEVRRYVSSGVCPECKTQQVCPGFDGPCPTTEKVPQYALSRLRISNRHGDPWRCSACATRRAMARRTPEDLSEAARKSWSKNRTQHSAAARAALSHKGNAALRGRRFEEWSEQNRRSAARRTAEERSDSARKAAASRTPDSRSATARKAAAASAMIRKARGARSPAA